MSSIYLSRDTKLVSELYGEVVYDRRYVHIIGFGSGLVIL
jgi:hypothetical protein